MDKILSTFPESPIILQDQEIKSMVTRRADDPPMDDFTAQRRDPIEIFYQHKFDKLLSILAHVEKNARDAKNDLHEQLTTIINTLSKLNQLSDKVDRLQQEIDEEREEHRKIEMNEARLEALIIDLGEKISHLERAHQSSWYQQLLFDVSPAALIILTVLAFYYVFLK